MLYNFKKRYDFFVYLDERIGEWPAIMLKCSLLLVMPALISCSFVFVWDVLMYQNGIAYLGKLTEGMLILVVTAVGMPYLVLLPSIVPESYRKFLNTGTISKVGEDVDGFMVLRVQHIDPIIHLTMFTSSMLVMVSIMGAEYPTEGSGIMVIGLISYSFAFLFFLVVELDHTCSGAFAIKDIDEEWLAIDERKWWLRNNPMEREKYRNHVRNRLREKHRLNVA